MSDKIIESQSGHDNIELNTRIIYLEDVLREKEAALDALQDSEKRYRRLFESARDGILILDAHTGVIVDVNPFMMQLLGYSYDEFCGKHLWEIGAFKDITASKIAFDTLQNNNYIRYDDLPLKTTDGRTVDVEFVSNIYLVDHFKVIQCNIRDITQRKQVEAECGRFLSAIEQAGEMIVITDPNGDIRYVNPAFEQVTGYSRDETIGKNLRMLKSGKQSTDFYKNLWETISGGGTFKGRIINKRKDGAFFTEAVTISPVCDPSGRIVNYVAIKRDITEHMQLEAKFQQAQKMESEVNYLIRIIKRPNLAGCLMAAFLFFILILSTHSTIAENRVSDEFLAGYVSSILERDLHWERNSYIIKIVNGVATITLFKDDLERMEAVDKQLSTIDGLQRIAIAVKPDHAGKPGAISRFIGISGKGESFPTGDLFRPLIADPKQPQFFAGINSFKSSGVRYTMASVGFGETFGMYRFFGSSEGDGLQLSIEGALFARFNMDTPSSDLINADYTIGIPVTYRQGDNSFRLRVYHQSSHLGDEFLKSINPPERVNLSYEAIDLIYSLEYLGWRIYGGGEYLIHKEPGDLKSMSGQWGIEYRATKPLLWNGRPVIGVNMKSFDEHDWAIDASVKAGFEFGHPNPGQRRLRLMAVWYTGFDPRGQFYNNKVDYYGLELSLGF